MYFPLSISRAKRLITQLSVQSEDAVSMKIENAVGSSVNEPAAVDINRRPVHERIAMITPSLRNHPALLDRWC